MEIENIKYIKKNGITFAIIVRNEFSPNKSEFISPDTFSQQLGFIVYSKDQIIVPHKHQKIGRNIQDTPETLFIKKGKVEAFIFSENEELIEKVILNNGDIICLVAGGHGFKMLEDSVIIEVKQGPFVGINDKIRFNWSEL